MSCEEHSCIDCGIRACRGYGGTNPPFCVETHLEPELLEKAKSILNGADNPMVRASAQNEFDGYGTRCRVEETMHLAKLMGARKLGIATCTGLLSEARQLARVFRAQGYEVFGIACKCGSVDKTDLGIREECNAVGPHACDPVLQALVLNREKTDLNIAFGLCAGHDSLFYKYSEAYVTTLVSKDRLLGHNPIAPLYLVDGYWKRLLKEDPYYTPAPPEGSETF